MANDNHDHWNGWQHNPQAQAPLTLRACSSEYNKWGMSPYDDAEAHDLLMVEMASRLPDVAMTQSSGRLAVQAAKDDRT